jgi:hypothetical protein
MQIAVFVCRNYGITLGEREDSDGFITRLQRFALAAFLRLEENPLDVVCVQHGMLHGADGHSYHLAVLLNHGDVLLARCVGGVGRKGLHLFAATMATDAGILDVCDDITAMFASVESHVKLLL